MSDQNADPNEQPNANAPEAGTEGAETPTEQPTAEQLAQQLADTAALLADANSRLEALESTAEQRRTEGLSEAERLAELESKLSEAESTLKAERIENLVTKVAHEKGVDAEAIIALAVKSGEINKADREAVEAAIDAWVERIPGLKATPADGEDNGGETVEEEDENPGPAVGFRARNNNGGAAGQGSTRELGTVSRWAVRSGIARTPQRGGVS